MSRVRVHTYNSSSWEAEAGEVGLQGQVKTRENKNKWRQRKQRSSERAQCVQVPAAKPDNLTLIPRLHMVKGENL